MHFSLTFLSSFLQRIVSPPLSLSLSHTHTHTHNQHCIPSLQQDDDEPADPMYAPDGAYIPRIFFAGERRCALAVAGGGGKREGNPSLRCFAHAFRALTPFLSTLSDPGCTSDSSGTVVEDIYNKFGSAKYKYYYSDAPFVVTSMRAAMKHFGVQENQ